jgi:hypothetical protein
MGGVAFRLFVQGYKKRGQWGQEKMYVKVLKKVKSPLLRPLYRAISQAANISSCALRGSSMKRKYDSGYR